MPAGDEALVRDSEMDAGQTASIGLSRSVNRAGLMLFACIGRLNQNILAKIKSRPEKSAVYYVTDYCTTAHAEVLKYMESGTPQAWSKHLPPKWGLQTNGMVAGALAILLGAEGGVHAFFHSSAASAHALEQAELDIESGRIDIAVIAAVSSLEDPVAIAKARQNTEGAALIVLARGERRIKFSADRSSKKQFGLAQPIIEFIQKEATHA